jgi:hypothetical protein
MDTASKNLDDEVNELFLLARVRQFTWDEWRLQRMGAEGALEELITAIRQESMLPRFPVMLRWRPEQPSESADRSASELDGAAAPPP